jgi:hypothetical protein
VRNKNGTSARNCKTIAITEDRAERWQRRFGLISIGLQSEFLKYICIFVGEKAVDLFLREASVKYNALAFGTIFFPFHVEKEHRTTTEKVPKDRQHTKQTQLKMQL